MLYKYKNEQKNIYIFINMIIKRCIIKECLAFHTLSMELYNNVWYDFCISISSGNSLWVIGGG